MIERPERAIESARQVFRLAGVKMSETGVAPIDIAIAALYAAHDMAPHEGGSPVAAIEWLRTGIDAMEDQLLRADRA